MKLKMPPKNTLNILCLMLSVFVFMFGIWQHDIITVGYVWNGEHVKPFQSFIWKTTIGEAYDTTLLLEFAAYWLAVIAVWTWEHERK